MKESHSGRTRTTIPSDCPVLIRILLLDCYASSTKVKVDSKKTANDICEILSTKLALAETDAMFYSLICVAKCVDKKSIQWVKTLKPNDNVLQIQIDMEDKAKLQCESKEIADTVTSSFYYKDLRSNPLDLDGEVSGNSSSDDETEIPLNDLLYFGAGERRGFLLKRSSRDPNVWRRRLCILNDKLWCINVRKSVPWARCVNLNHATVLEDCPGVKYTNTIALLVNGGQTLFFRTNAPLEKHRWREEIRERTLYGADNEVIMMAEIIITDEEALAETQIQKCYVDILRTPKVWNLVGKILKLTPDLSVDFSAEDINEKKGGYNINEVHIDTGRSHSPMISSPGISSTNRKSASRSPPPYRGAMNGRVHSPSRNRSGSMRGRINSFRSIEDSSESNQTMHLSKKLGRWPYQIFHALHVKNPACAAGVSLICAVHRYKEAFRHGFYSQHKELWGNALIVYLNHVLPYMDFIKTKDEDQRSESLDSARLESDDTTESRVVEALIGDEDHNSNSKSVAITPSRHISMSDITSLHRELFFNIRKKRKNIALKTDETEGAKTTSQSYTGWFWTSLEKNAGNSSAEIDNSVENKNEIQNTDYEIIDSSIKPDIKMFDVVVEAVYKVLGDV